MKSEPQVGIFWLVNHKLVTETTPVSQAELYLNFRTHAGDHVTSWESLRRAGVVPSDLEYDEVPRGRLIYDAARDQFTLMADQHILHDKQVLAKIMTQFNLPANTITDTDRHYRCPECLWGEDQDED